MLYNRENVIGVEYVYSIGELAKIGKISVRTLRYYDEINLLEPTEVKEGGRRFYNESSKRPLSILIRKEHNK